MIYPDGARLGRKEPDSIQLLRRGTTGCATGSATGYTTGQHDGVHDGVRDGPYDGLMRFQPVLRSDSAGRRPAELAKHTLPPHVCDYTTPPNHRKHQRDTTHCEHRIDPSTARLHIPL